jgi:hypothetical protein
MARTRLYVNAKNEYAPEPKATATHYISLSPTGFSVSDLSTGKQLDLRTSQKVASRVMFWFTERMAKEPHHPDKPYAGYNPAQEK